MMSSNNPNSLTLVAFIAAMASGFVLADSQSEHFPALKEPTRVETPKNLVRVSATRKSDNLRALKDHCLDAEAAFAIGVIPKSERDKACTLSK